MRYVLREFQRTARLLVLLLSTGCATAGATVRSGVGDAFLEHPPWYAGRSASDVRGENASIGHFPVVFQRGAAQAAIFDPSSDDASPTAQLLREMNAYLDSLTAATGVSVRLVDGGRTSAVASRAAAQRPDVHFGCLTEGGLPGEDCAERGDSALGRGLQQMRLAVGRPSAEWVAWMNDVARERGVQRTLVLTLEVGQYLTRQRGLLGRKEVELGTGYAESLPWLTSLETPVAVLQLTGALVGPDGRALRIGAEGIVARRTRLLASAVGAQEVLRDEEVAQARTLRRADLPGSPLAWQVALRTLVASLTGRAELAG